MAADEAIQRDYEVCIRGLIAELAQTRHASEAFRANERHRNDLSKALAQMPNRIASLDRQRETSLRKHTSSRGSIVRRFAFRLIGRAGRFESGADQNRQCYYDILHQEHKAKEEEHTLREQHASVARIVEDLEPAARRHREVQDELDNLFEELFAGARDGDQECAALKNDVERARQAWHTAQATADHARLAVTLLTAATKDVQKARSEVGKALLYDPGMLDGGYSVEKKHLRQAQAHVSAAQLRFGQAQRLTGPRATAVMAGPDATTTYNAIQRYRQSGMCAKVGLRDMIRQYGRELEAYARGLRGQLARGEARRAETGAEAQRQGRALEKARERLRAAHTRAFLRMVGKEAWPSGGMDEAVTAEWTAPPAYQP